MTAVDPAQISLSADFAATLTRASEFASGIGARQVDVTHLLAALCGDPDALAMLQRCEVDIEDVKADIAEHIPPVDEASSDSTYPLPLSEDVQRILQGASDAARSSRGRDVNGAIILAAIVGDADNVGAEILRGHRVTFEVAVQALQTLKGVAKAQTSHASAGARARANSMSPDLTPKTGVQKDATPQRDIKGEEPSIIPSAGINAGAAANASSSAALPRPSSIAANGTSDPTRQSQENREGENAKLQPAEPSAKATPSFSRSEAAASQAAPTFNPSASPAFPASHLPAQSSRQQPGPFAASAAPPNSEAPTATTSNDILERIGREKIQPVGPPPPPIPGSVFPPSPFGAGVLGRQPSPPSEPQLSARSVPSSNLRVEPDLPTQRRAAAPIDNPNAPMQRAQKEIADGQLAENIPRRMQIGRTETAEIRVAKASIAELGKTLEGGGQAFSHSISVTQAMAVRLRAPAGGFVIEAASPETQWIENSLGFASDDFASWHFRITPQTRGRARLQIIVAARTAGPGGVVAETALPDQVIEVKVDRNVGRSLKRVVTWTVVAVVGGAVATFGEAGVELAKKLLHIGG